MRIRFVGMDASTVIALLAVVIAVIVPWFTFRLALRQDQVRWMREQRSELYVDMLAEANAEFEWLQFENAPESTRGAFTDKRLPLVERARLRARGSIFGSRAVNQAFINAAAETSKLLAASRNGAGLQLDVLLAGHIDELLQAIRRELGTDRVPLESRDAAGENPDPPSIL